MVVCFLRKYTVDNIERKEYVKKNNTYAVVLRAGLSLSMLFGVALHAEHARAAEEVQTPVDENAPTEILPEVEDTSIDENVEELSVNETELEPEVLLEEPEVNQNDSQEKSEDSETLHNNAGGSKDEEDKDSISPDHEINSEEATLADELETIEEKVVDPIDNTDLPDAEVEAEAVSDTFDKTSENDEEEIIEESHSDETTSSPDAMTLSAPSGKADELIKVDRIEGDNRFKNAVEISKKGWSTAPKVFIANGHKFADSLTGAPLASLNNAPILLTRVHSLPEETLTELKRLNTKEVVILGGEVSVSANVVNTLTKNGFKVTRIGGTNRYNQAELVANAIIASEGKNRDAFLASGQVFSDALSIATIASNKRLPIYLTRGMQLEQSVLNAIPYVNSWTVIGGETTIAPTVVKEMENAGAKVKRIGGKNRYEVNRNVLNNYGVPEDHLYVTSGEHYSDTLPASVLASKEGSGVLLVADNGKNVNAEQKIFAQNKNKVHNFTIVGGPATLSKETEEDLKELIRTVDKDILEAIKRQYSNYTFSEYNITLKDALEMQMLSQTIPQTDKRYLAFVSKDFINGKTNTVTADVLNVRSGAGTNNHIIAQLTKGSKVEIINELGNWYQINLKQYWLNASEDDVAYYLNPNNFILSERQKFQFLDLTRPSNASVEVLNTFLKGKGILEGKGQAFIDAGNMHNVNEIYLIAHALHETGNGTSELAKGVQVNGNKVYNMYGIGATDDAPVVKGARRANEEKWYTPEAAIIGGAAFIGDGYVNAGQNTLYKMRWNPDSMATNGYATHQYATDIGWAYKQVNTIYSIYQAIGLDVRHVDIPVYLA